MVEKRTLAIIALSAILIVSGASYLLFNTDMDSDNEDAGVSSNIFEVSDEHDDARTFTVEMNDLDYGNEDGEWAGLQLAPSYSFGVRFTDINIPNNAKIIDAYIELYSTGSPGLRHPNCKIYCDDVDNATNFVEIGVLDICGRNYTDNYSLWNETVSYGEWVKTPVIKNVIQEVVSRENWTVNNSISVLFVSNGIRGYSATFQNFEKGYPARLCVKWKENLI